MFSSLRSSGLERGIAQRRMQWMTNALIARGILSPSSRLPRTIRSAPYSQISPTGPHSVSRGPSGELIWRGNFHPRNFQLRTSYYGSGCDCSHLATHGRSGRETPASRHYSRDRTTPPLPTVSTAHVLTLLLRVRSWWIYATRAWPDLSTYISSGGTTHSSPSTGRRVFSALTPPGQDHRLRDKPGRGSSNDDGKPRFVLATRWAVPTLHVSNLRAWKARSPLDTPPAAEADRLEVLYTGTVGRAQGLSNALDALELLQQRDQRALKSYWLGSTHVSFTCRSHPQGSPRHVFRPDVSRRGHKTL